jgi:predicted negative regulator of RcsB-dependent stress response
MSEEQVTQEEGTWSGLKKTLIGTISTVILGAGTWVGTTFFGGKEEAAPAPAAAQPSIIINNTQAQQQAAGGTKVIERVVEKPAAKPAEPAPKKKEFSEEPKW